jgi:hypothetical protein
MTSYICSEVVHNEIFVFKGQGLKDAHVGDVFVHGYILLEGLQDKIVNF